MQPDVPLPGRIKVSEIFESVQGEGASAGTPCVFLRLAHCNLTCDWCDTKYTWDFKRHRYEDEVRIAAVREVVDRLRGAGRSHLVVTGGEPLLQQPALTAVLAALPAELYVEVETNGTLTPTADLLSRVDQWNVSPKLASSGEPERRRLRAEVLATLQATLRAWLKLVVEHGDELREVEALISELRWPRDRVMLMAQAATRDELRQRAPAIESAAARAGFRYSPRLHVERWNGVRGT